MLQRNLVNFYQSARAIFLVLNWTEKKLYQTDEDNNKKNLLSGKNRMKSINNQNPILQHVDSKRGKNEYALDLICLCFLSAVIVLSISEKVC